MSIKKQLGRLFYGNRKAAAKIMDTAGLWSLGFHVQRALYGKAFLRCVNYHDTPAEDAKSLDAHFRFYAERYHSVGKQELLEFFQTGSWPHTKPGIIITFDDGLRSNYTTAVELLEEHGLTGWFFLPVEFIDAANENSMAWAEGHRIQFRQTYENGRIAMSWDEVKDLEERGHVLGCHTMSHCRMYEEVPAEQVEREIVTGKAVLEERLGHEVESYCWVGGEPRTYSADAKRAVERAGYVFSFMSCSSPIVASTNPLHIHRSHVDSPWKLELVRMQLSGLMDLLYWPRRKDINAL
jgi:peptidoglycan/xylan/chitin deacetylase (PgdA/CDA1 family)